MDDADAGSRQRYGVFTNSVWVVVKHIDKKRICHLRGGSSESLRVRLGRGVELMVFPRLSPLPWP